MRALRNGGWVAAAILLLIGRPALGQDELKVQVSYTLGKQLELQRLVLRPNTTQPVYFYVTNPDIAPRRNVSFKLVRLAADGQPFVLQQTTIEVIKAKETVRVNFAKGAPAVKEEKKETGKPAPPPPWPQLEGPPFRVQVWIDSDKGPDPVKINVPVLLMEPREYVSVGGGMTYDSKSNKLSVRVKAAKDFSGSPESPCPVQLVLSPELLPGLVATKKGGVFKQNLTEPDQEIELIAIDLRFQDAPPKNGRIYLTVDGYERAFMFKTTFAQGILPTLGEERRIRIYAPHYSQPGPKFPVRLEVDGPPSTSARIELGLDRVGNGQAFDAVLFKGLRRQTVSLGTSPEGDLLFKTEIQDWKFDLDTAEVFGKRTLRAQMLDGYLKQGNRNVMALADEQNQREETITMFQRNAQDLLAPLSFANDAVFAEVVLDATAPEGLKFVKLPSALAQGQAHNLKLKARVKPRSEDQAPISTVKFYLGKAGPEGKLPEEAVDGKVADDKGDIYEAELLVPSDKKDKFEVSVLATTRTGVSAETTEKILLTAPGATTAAKKTNRITGTVKEGDRAQAGLAVVLRDEKGKPKSTVKTDASGVYVFENVAPGNYTVFTARSASQTKGQAAVTVAEDSGTISKIDIKLFR